MDILHVIILSAIEGVTEFLPISSTGHLILASRILKIPDSDFLKTFEIVIQSGAMIAIINLYWKKLIADLSLIKKALLGLIPTVIIGFLAYPIFKDVLLESTQIVSISLIIGGVAILFIEHRLKSHGNKGIKHIDKLNELTYKQAFITGLTQSLAIIPGVSRSAASIFGGMSIGLSRKTATEFSFILALPTIFAATGFDLAQKGTDFTQGEIISLVIGILVSYIVALFAIKWLLKFVSTHSFVAFGWYRIILGIVFLLLFWR